MGVGFKNLYLSLIVLCFIAAQGSALPHPQNENGNNNADEITTLPSTPSLLSSSSKTDIENVTIASTTPIVESTTPSTVDQIVVNSSTTILPSPMIEWLYNSTSQIEPLTQSDNPTSSERIPSSTEIEEMLLMHKMKDSNMSENSIGMDYSEEGMSSTTSTSVFVSAPARIDPSIQLVPPPLPQQVSSTVSPVNIRDIPLSLVSLSGNSGGSEQNIPQGSNNKEENIPVDFTQYRYHVETGKLHKIGSTGPGICPPNMRFFAVPGHNKNGACDCDYYQCSRPLLYSLEKHQCYRAWSQGPCKDDEWFVFHHDLRQRGICSKNPCINSTDIVTTINGYLPTPPPSYSSYVFQNPNDGKCYEAGTNGYCSDKDERLLIFPGEVPIPTCRKYTFCYPLTVPQELQCIYGSKYYLEGGQC